MLAGRYRLVRRIATGGMGTVDEAVDVRLGRRVAVKVLKGEYADDPRFVERFAREARAAAGLIHPNIAQVFDHGYDAGRYFIVMEYIDGSDLGHALSHQRRLSPARATRIAGQLCSALAAAHAVGTVHRDVKPSNVLLAASDQVKLTDFGIAQAQGQTALTGTGLVLGTARYLSPEQAAGQPATPASDVYSAGIVLFEMLTGTVPFTAATPVAVAHHHLTREVPPVRDLVPEVPPILAAVVARATTKDPSQRYPEAAAMAAALRDDLEPRPQPAPTAVLPAGGPTPSAPAGAAQQRASGQLRWFLAGAAILLAVGLLTGGVLLSNGSSPQTTDIAKPSDHSTARPATPAPKSAPHADDSAKHPTDPAGHDTTKRKKHKDKPPHDRGQHRGKGHPPGHGSGHED